MFYSAACRVELCALRRPVAAFSRIAAKAESQLRPVLLKPVAQRSGFSANEPSACPPTNDPICPEADLPRQPRRSSGEKEALSAGPDPPEKWTPIWYSRA